MGTIRPLAVLAVALGVLALGPGPLTAVGGAEDACADHVCQCLRAHRCPTRRTSSSSCHGREASPAGCEMRGACRHDQAAAPRDGLAWAPPEAMAASPTLLVEPHRSARTAVVAVGFSRIDPRPPRSA